MYVNGGMIPTFLLFKTLHLTNSFWVYVIPGMFSAFNMLVIRTYMNGISDSLEESAQLDGAGYTTIFLKIISRSANRYMRRLHCLSQSDSGIHGLMQCSITV